MAPTRKKNQWYLGALYLRSEISLDSNQIASIGGCLLRIECVDYGCLKPCLYMCSRPCYPTQLPSRDGYSMLKKFLSSKELKTLARISYPAKSRPNDEVSINGDSASDEGDVKETAGDSKVHPTTVKG